MEKSDIVYSCYHEVNSKGENFVPKHTLSFQMSGSFVLASGKEKLTAKEGDFNLIRKNQLVKYTKYPPKEGKFESLNIYLNDDILKEVAKEYRLSSHPSYSSKSIVSIDVTPVLQNYIKSLQTIIQNPEFLTKHFTDLKIKELLFILLQYQPELKDLLFDFSEPFKIDLESFMIQNYRYNVNLERFAYLTGRSLSTFKRDFQKIFDTTPHQWILKKRLRDAYFALTEMRQSPSEIYMDLGFEDLSHFSSAFKKEFGYSPKNLVTKHIVKG